MLNITFGHIYIWMYITIPTPIISLHTLFIKTMRIILYAPSILTNSLGRNVSNSMSASSQCLLYHLRMDVIKPVSSTELTVSFIQTVYTADEDENGTVSVCAVAEGANEVCPSFDIGFEIINGSAGERLL